MMIDIEKVWDLLEEMDVKVCEKYYLADQNYDSELTKEAHAQQDLVNELKERMRKIEEESA